MILATTMDDSEHFLANYQQFNAIKLDEESDNDNDGDPSKQYTKIPKVSSKRAIKQTHKEEVEHFVSEYKKEVFTEKDYRLMKGVISTKIMKNGDVKRLELDEEVPTSTRVPNSRNTLSKSKRRRISGSFTKMNLNDAISPCDVKFEEEKSDSKVCMPDKMFPTLPQLRISKSSLDDPRTRKQ